MFCTEDLTIYPIISLLPFYLFLRFFFIRVAAGVGLFKKGVRAVQAVSRASRFFTFLMFSSMSVHIILCVDMCQSGALLKCKKCRAPDCTEKNLEAKPKLPIFFPSFVASRNSAECRSVIPNVAETSSTIRKCGSALKLHLGRVCFYLLQHGKVHVLLNSIAQHNKI